MNADIYERHKTAVELWRMACETVQLAEKKRDELRQTLDAVGQELLASCANSISKSEKKTRRGRKPKVNGNSDIVGTVTGRIVRKSNGVEDYADLA